MRRVIGLILVALLTFPLVGAAIESTDQMQLVGSPAFLSRIQYLLAQQARVVKAEALNTACHVSRSNYATAVLNNPAGIAPSAAVIIVGGINLIGTVTGTAPNATSSASDAAILSQVSTFWSHLSGCDTGT